MPLPSSFLGSIRLSAAALSRFERVMSGQQAMRVGERSEAVRALQMALMSLGHAIPNGPTDFFGNSTNAAVRAFQGKHVATLGQPDGIVGPKTLGLVSSTINDSPSDDPLVTDMVIYFEGNQPEARLAGDEVISVTDLGPSYMANHTPPERWGYRTTNIEGDLAAQSTVESLTRIGLAQAAGTLSRIYIFGASAGGRMALNLAAKLTLAQIPIRMVAITDAAFFPDLTPPPKTLTDKTPIFPGGNIAAGIKLNYYHTLGNRVWSNPKSFFALQWWSMLDYKEIHGKVTGFSNLDGDLTAEVSRTFYQKEAPTNHDLAAHIMCNKIALKKIRFRILEDMNPLRMID